MSTDPVAAPTQDLVIRLRVSRTLTRLFLGSAVAALLFAATCEVVVRVASPAPRAQILRPSPTLSLGSYEGTPLWSTPLDHELAGLDCVGSRHIVFAGDSIFHTTASRTAAAVFTTRLQQLARQAGRDWCLHNLSVPAYAGPQKSAVARRALETMEAIDLVVYGIWNEDAHYERLGDSIYELSSHYRDEAGYPAIPGMPANAITRALFRHSRAWEYAALALAVRTELPPGDPVARRRAPLAAVLEAAGTTPVLAVALPALSRSFSESADNPDPMRHEVVMWAAAHGAPTMRLAELLRAEDVEALRLDRCCHYNDAGHEVLAEVFYEVLAALVAVE